MVQVSEFGRRFSVDHVPTMLARIRRWRRAGLTLIENERAHFTVNASLWAPVMMGGGAVAYFSLKNEPAPWLAPLCVFLCGLVAMATHRQATRLCFVGLLLAAVGFGAADWRTARVGAPVLERELGFVTVTGRILTIEDREKDQRLTIAPHTIERISADQAPARIRVTWRGTSYGATDGSTGVGALVELRASLSPPPPPAAPGAFNFARQLYFQRIGAVGFVVSAPEVIDPAPSTGRARFAAFVERTRVKLARRITAAAPGQGGAIVAAVVTGKRGAIDETSTAALRDSGLAHLLAISGLHMGLATGLIFFSIRFLLATMPMIALRFPIKKWAATAALFSGFGYLILSGGGWSARRAFIMTAVVFIAILVDRRALSLRNVAIAACIILLTTPEAVLHPGFQMSFAAVTALIAAYEWHRGREAVRDTDFTLLGRMKRYAIGVAATDTIAAVATAPFSLYHFHRAAIYSLPANLIAMPLMAFWIMPSAIIGLALAPMGLDGWAWQFSAAGVEQVLSAGGYVSSMKGAVVTMASAPPFALGVTAFGGLVLCLLKTPLRFLGLIFFPVVGVLSAGAPTPAAIFSHRGDNAAVFAPSSEGEKMALFVYNRRKDRFAQNVWMETAGLDPKLERPENMTDGAACDPRGCVSFVAGKRIAISADPLSFAEDCARADAIIALYALPRDVEPACNGLVLTRRDAWRGGAHALFIQRDGRMGVKNAFDAIGERPWR